jgi:hypothetical protein
MRPSEQVLENVRLSNRVGRTCKILFFLALVYAVFMGQGLFIVSEGDGYKINFVSAFGILLAFYCIFFILRDYRAILKLSWFRMLIGFLGIAAFLTHSVLALFAPMQLLEVSAAGRVISGPVGFFPIAGTATGAEQWIIEGRSYNIKSSYFLVLPEGVQYTVTYQLPPAQVGVEDEQAELLAFPIMVHIVENELHLRTWIGTLDGKINPERIGITFLYSQGQGATGYRYGLSIGEIKKRIAAAENQT